MDKHFILHMLTTEKNLSPFDVNMAADAGWQHIIPYTSIVEDEVCALIQDAIFSRGPSGVKRTGVFIGGRDLFVALKMLNIARKSMVPPFEISCFADPSGAFTTAAGMIAMAERHLAQSDKSGFGGKKVVVLGGTGPVGAVAGILASKAGADVFLISRNMEKAAAMVSRCQELMGPLKMHPGDEMTKQTELPTTHIVLAAAAAGVQVMNEAALAAAAQLQVAADVNAVPPLGIAGVEVRHDSEPIVTSTSNAVGIGALAVGNVKYQTQHRLFKKMHISDKPVYLHFEHACDVARECVREGS